MATCRVFLAPASRQQSIATCAVLNLAVLLPTASSWAEGRASAGAISLAVADANKKLGANAKNAVFTGATVPATAVWVKPGEEYNVGPYWRVFKAQMNFTVDGKNVQIPIESMISWRGQWYVVHLGTIR